MAEQPSKIYNFNKTTKKKNNSVVTLNREFIKCNVQYSCLKFIKLQAMILKNTVASKSE